jgi:hypothetical protein
MRHFPKGTLPQKGQFLNWGSVSFGKCPIGEVSLWGNVSHSDSCLNILFLGWEKVLEMVGGDGGGLVESTTHHHQP